MTTVANIKKSDGSHWYYPDGQSCYELPKKDGSGTKVPTLADARKLNLIPGVTSILKLLHKQALVEWLIEQAVLAVVTTPRSPDEGTDAFIDRVLRQQRVQDEEAQRARDKGTEIHDALEMAFLGKIDDVNPDIVPWIRPAFDDLRMRGTLVASEINVVGHGYAGRVDLIQRDNASEELMIWDFKSTKKLPKDAPWTEHRLQLSAYARAYSEEVFKKFGKVIPIRVGNVYISTLIPGEYVILTDPDWSTTYSQGFMPLVGFWQWVNRYAPLQEGRLS